MKCKEKSPKVSDNNLEEPLRASESSHGQALKGSTAKRKISCPSPSPPSCNKSQRTKSPLQNRMSEEEVKKLTLDVASVQATLGLIVKQGADNLDLGKKTMTEMAAMDKETKAMIEMNTRGLNDFKEHQNAQNITVDARLAGVETEVAELKGLVQSGISQGTLVGESRGYNHESEHESNLRSMITKAKACVTMLGAEDTDMTHQKVILAMSKSYPAHGITEAAILAMSKLGPSASTTSPYKLEMLNSGLAESLIELSVSRQVSWRTSVSRTSVSTDTCPD